MNHRSCYACYGVLLADIPGEVTVPVPALVPVPGLSPVPVLTVGSGLSGADGVKFTLGNMLGIIDTPGDTPAEGCLFWFVHPTKTATSAMIIIIAIISLFIKSPPLNLFLTKRRLIISEC